MVQNRVFQLSDIQIRDPFIYSDGQYFYLCGSTDKDIWHTPGVGFDVYKGAAPGVFTEFEGPFEAFRPPANFWARYNFWAPEIYRYHDAYYMFATFKPDDNWRGTAVLRSDGPLGPFVPWSDHPVTPVNWACLDGTLHIEDGTPYMVFCHEWQQIGDGQIAYIQLSDDLRTSIGGPTVLFSAHQASWPKGIIGRAPGSYVTDGPNMHRDSRGRLHMLWSSLSDGGAYALGVATSESGSIVGPWTQHDEPLFTADGGHGMIFTAPDQKTYLAVHMPNDTPNERPVFVEIVETDDGLRATDTIIS